MMAILPKWQSKLTAKQRRHLTEMNAGTLAAFRRTREGQAQYNRGPGEPAACHECDAIARRLGWDA